MGKVTKASAAAPAGEKKLAKVDKKSVAIQKADKKAVKNLKAKVENVPAVKATTKKVKQTSPKKNKKAKDASKPKKLQKKTKPSGGSPIVPKKAKKLLKAGALAQSKGKHIVKREDVVKAVQAFREMLKVGLASLPKAMLDPDFRYILQLCSFKVPKCPDRMARTQLAHSLVDETDDICLFVKDVEQGNKRDYQPTIDFFKEKLAAAGITNIKTIMPIAQVTKDYKQHEMLRKLCNSYDLFLTDGRIAPHLAKKLGKVFVMHKKSPISVRLNHPKLKEHFARAAAKISYHQTNTGDSTSIHIGKHGMSDEAIVDNVFKVLENMRNEFPGGYANIKRVFLRPAINLPKSSVPVYVNAGSGENVSVPVIEGPRAKALKKKQKAMNKLLPEGLVMTNKGELQLVEGANKRPADSSEAEEKVPKKKGKKEDKKNKVEKAEKAAKEAVKKQEPEKGKQKEKKEKKEKEDVVETAPVAEAKPKKDEKAKKVVEEAAVEAPVEEKKQKKSKKATAIEEAAKVTPVEKVKKGKKAKKQEEEEEAVDGGELTKAVSDLWEQIKSESSTGKGKKRKAKAEVDQEWEQFKNESVEELGDLSEEPKKAKKNNKKKPKAVEAVPVEVKKSKKAKK